MTWVREAFQALMKRPLGYLGMFLAFLFAMVLASVIPLVGMVFVMMSLPLLTLGFMIATRSVVHDGPAHPGQFIEPLRADAARRRELLVLCALYALATFVIMSLSDLVDDGRFERLQELMAASTEAPGAQAELDVLLGEPQLYWGMVVRFGLATVLSIPFWHAPALVWWGGQGAGQALFSSTLACWRTRGALTLYVALWGALVAGSGAIVTMLASMVGGQAASSVVAFPAALLFSCAFYASLYFTFRDTFASDQMIDTPLA